MWCARRSAPIASGLVALDAARTGARCPAHSLLPERSAFYGNYPCVLPIAVACRQAWRGAGGAGRRHPIAPGQDGTPRGVRGNSYCSYFRTAEFPLSPSPTGCNFWIERNCPLVLLPTENTTSALFIVVTFSFDRSLRWAFFLKTELSSTTGTCGLLAHSGPLAQLIPAWPLPAFQSLTLYPKCGTSLRT